MNFIYTKSIGYGRQSMILERHMLKQLLKENILNIIYVEDLNDYREELLRYAIHNGSSEYYNQDFIRFGTIYELFEDIFLKDREFLKEAIRKYPPIINGIDSPDKELQVIAVSSDWASADDIHPAESIVPEVVDILSKTSARLFTRIITKGGFKKEIINDSHIKNIVERAPNVLTQNSIVQSMITPELLHNIIYHKETTNKTLKFIYNKMDISALSDDDKLYLEITELKG